MLYDKFTKKEVLEENFFQLKSDFFVEMKDSFSNETAYCNQ